MSFGWHRAQILGAFFNGVFLLALSVSTFLQSIERLISLQRKFISVIHLLSTNQLNNFDLKLGIESPILVLTMGCIGLVMNIMSIFLLRGKFPFRASEIRNKDIYRDRS